MEASRTGKVEGVTRRSDCEVDGTLGVLTELELDIFTADRGGERSAALKSEKA